MSDWDKLSQAEKEEWFLDPVGFAARKQTTAEPTPPKSIPIHSIIDRPDSPGLRLVQERDSVHALVERIARERFPDAPPPAIEIEKPAIPAPKPTYNWHNVKMGAGLWAFILLVGGLIPCLIYHYTPTKFYIGVLLVLMAFHFRVYMGKNR
jgi:hypothetical protein